jgi:eukaryotic-like serine/threonine-protein kinase
MASAASPAGSISETRVIAQKYRLDTLLGEGGMGAVWRAYNLQLEAPVAIKLLRSGLDSTELGERLRVEARAAAKLVHPNIVRVFDVGDSETGEPFIVMELLDGESLRDILLRGPLPAVNAVQLLLPVAEALSLAHSRGVVHRDIKPDNVFIANVGETLQPKLLDFGIAKVTSTAAAGGAVLTSTGTVLGSPEYMSPEQAMGRADIDHRSDVWSFCVVLYEALCGRTPFTGDTAQVVLRSVVQDVVMPLEIAAGVDHKLSELISRGLSKEREARPQSMFELGQALAAWLFEQGALEDAAGAGLEYKWLGRATEGVALSNVHVASSPRAKHDEATLVSVVHPSPLPGSTTPASPPVPRRGRGWVATAAVLGVALWGCAAWALLHGASAAQAPRAATNEVQASASRVYVAAAPAELAATPPAPPATAATPAHVALQALPIEPAAAAPKPLAAKPAVPAVRTSRSTAAGSLPRALPATNSKPALPRELLNPY